MPPTVSICCVTYNHASTVAQALDSFLAQQSDVTIEVLVHDDASTDGTQEIIRRYAKLYPDVVKPLYETENQYGKGTAMDATFNFPRAKGEYIALCEGDDTWSDPHKLQKQIAAMRAHPTCTFCFTNGTVRDESGQTPDRVFIPYYPEEAAWYTPKTREYDLGEITRLSFLPTASFLFPRAALAKVPAELLLSPCPSGDLRLKLCLTAVGKALYLHDFTCVYRFNAPSSAMARWGAEAPEKTRLRCQQVIAMLEGVDTLSGGRCHTELTRLMDAQRLVMLAAAPTRTMLADAEVRRVYRALPPLGRLKCHLKILLPAPVFRAIRGILPR
jgi:glycosyltransferase involved in cell wall biosynthesis